jgi:hypothetical protein
VKLSGLALMELRGRSRSLGPRAGGVQEERVSIKLTLGSYFAQEVGAHTSGGHGPNAGET